MSIPEITPKAFFACRSNIKQNAHFISDFQVLYPAGSVLVIHNYYENRQRYIKLYEKSSVLEMIAISSSRKYAAIIENGERGQIIIYDLQSLKRRRTLNLPTDSTTSRFETLTFSHDDKYIMTITGDPDWMMVSYNWEKGKVDSLVKANYPNSPTMVIQICCSPNDNSEICLFGPGLFRLLTLSETVWRQYGFQKADQINITAACWLTNDRILCGTADGKLLLLEGGELKAVFNALTVTVINVKEKEEFSTSTSSLTILKSSSDFDEDEDKQVRSLIVFTKGFAYSCKSGLVHMFEKESPTQYKKRNVFKIVDLEYRGSLDFDLNIVKHLSINVSQDKLLATTNRSQIYTVRLWGPDIHVAPEIRFKISGEPLHHGPIIGLCMCVWKPIFLTCGKFDRTLRLWNYDTERVEMVKHFEEDIFSVALHPTGLFVSIGFSEKLRFMIVLPDDIQPCRDFPIRECLVSVFSCHGHFLAAAKHGTIEIFNYVSFENVFVLKGHSAEIRSMVWSADDKVLVSCSADGTIVEWDAIAGRKIGEVVTKGVSYTDCAISSDGKFIYAVSTDGIMREISESSVLRCIEVDSRALECIVLSRSDFMMFLAGDSGSVLSVKIPINIPIEYLPFLYHYSKISHMKLSYDDQTLVTASIGGAVIIWKLSRTEGKTVTMDKDFSYSTDVLISRVELQEKIDSLKELSVKLFDLEMDHAQLMRSSETEYAESIKEIEDNYNQTIQEMKEKIDQLETDQESQLVKINQDVKELKLKQEKEVKDLESNYGAKLTLEKEKISVSAGEKKEIADNYEKRFSELKQSKELATEEIIKLFEEKLVDINRKLQESYEERLRLIQEHGKIKLQFEDDADREIVETRAQYEMDLKKEREDNELLKEEALDMKKKYVSAQKEIDEYRLQIETLQADHQKHQFIIQGLEKDIQDLKKEIVERGSTIDDKDQRIYDLKKKIQELEKFKFVLDYKIKEMDNQINPKDREIQEKKDQIKDMEKELENLQSINTTLELQLKELREKINATEKEIVGYESKFNIENSVLKLIKIDLYNLYQHIEDFKKLKEGIKNLYLKYNQEEILGRSEELDNDLQKEFMVQREFLEKTILSLQSTLNKSQESKKDDGLKVLEDNVVLVEELNQMRKQLKETIRKVRNMEELLGVKPGRSVTPREAFSKLQQCLRKKEAVRREYEDFAETAWNETNDLNKRIATLYENIEALIPAE